MENWNPMILKKGILMSKHFQCVGGLLREVNQYEYFLERNAQKT